MPFQSSQNNPQMQSHYLSNFIWKKENTVEKDGCDPFFRSGVESEQGYVSLTACR